MPGRRRPPPLERRIWSADSPSGGTADLADCVVALPDPITPSGSAAILHRAPASLPPPAAAAEAAAPAHQLPQTGAAAAAAASRSSSKKTAEVARTRAMPDDRRPAAALRPSAGGGLLAGAARAAPLWGGRGGPPNGLHALPVHSGLPTIWAAAAASPRGAGPLPLSVVADGAVRPAGCGGVRGALILLEEASMRRALSVAEALSEMTGGGGGSVAAATAEAAEAEPLTAMIRCPPSPPPLALTPPTTPCASLLSAANCLAPALPIVMRCATSDESGATRPQHFAAGTDPARSAASAARNDGSRNILTAVRPAAAASSPLTSSCCGPSSLSSGLSSAPSASSSPFAANTSSSSEPAAFPLSAPSSLLARRAPPLRRHPPLPTALHSVLATGVAAPPPRRWTADAAAEVAPRRIPLRPQPPPTAPPGAGIQQPLSSPRSRRRAHTMPTATVAMMTISNNLRSPRAVD